MAPRNAPAQDGPSTTDITAPPPRRRLSMEEDYLYQEVMTTPRRPSHPPPYQRVSSRSSVSRHADGTGKGKELATGGGDITNDTMEDDDESLPEYKNSIWLEGIFSRKHEIENTTKRAEDRQWHTSYATLNGTALNIYRAKKNWGLGRTRDDGPSVDPDNPPWMGKGKLEKSYSLLHADAGIAADYKKRRYVIRIRAETDQFLLSCVELSTFVKWLEGLFAAIDVAAPIDDRDFPRDMSIPRIQRIRWFRGQSPTQTTVDLTEVELPNPPQEVSAPEAAGQQVSTSPVNTLENQTRVEPEPEIPGDEGEESVQPPPRSRDPFHRLSTTSYPNLAVDPHSGKWFPEHCWSSAHDMLYAKLCYSNLLFRSPRKSNFIISKGKQWFVDWTTGRMVRVLPPAYGDIEWFGPWQVIHTENRRI